MNDLTSHNVVVTSAPQCPYKRVDPEAMARGRQDCLGRRRRAARSSPAAGCVASRRPSTMGTRCRADASYTRTAGADLEGLGLPLCWIDESPGRRRPPSLRESPLLPRAPSTQIASTLFSVCRPFAEPAVTLRETASTPHLAYDRASRRRPRQSVKESTIRHPQERSWVQFRPETLDTDVGGRPDLEIHRLESPSGALASSLRVGLAGLAFRLAGVNVGDLD
jgi:hypothetical protein